MMTVRHIEKLWNGQGYERLMRDLLAGRPEASIRLSVELPAGAIPAAALALLRLEELSQSHVPLYSKLLRLVLAAQDRDGGWSDPLTTALCLRALLAGRGEGAAVERGLFYLAQMQKPEGIWPKVPIRRMPADPFVSAFILLELGAEIRFRDAVRFMDALNWFEDNETTLDPETRRLWDHAFIRCAIRRTDVTQTVMSWS